MENFRKKNPVLGNAFLYGGIAAICYVIWFLIMRAFGLHDNFRLRYLNYPILLTCIYVCMNKMHKEREYSVPYLLGFAQSVLIAAFSGVVFGAFFFLYLTFFDHPLAVHLANNAPFGWVMTPMSFAFWVGHELLGFSIILSFIMMEYFKLVQNQKGKLKNINLATFAERPKRKLWGLVFLSVGIIALIATFISMISPDTYPHISGLLRLDSDNLWKISWKPIIAALFIALGVIKLSEFNRRKWVE